MRLVIKMPIRPAGLVVAGLALAVFLAPLFAALLP